MSGGLNMAQYEYRNRGEPLTLTLMHMLACIEENTA